MKNSIKISRKELYEKVWSVPLSQLCKEYNLSDNGLRKICIKQDIPLPISGYWSKVRFGKKVIKTKLPDNSDAEIIIEIKSSENKSSESFSDPISKYPDPILIIPDELKEDVTFIRQLDMTFSNIYKSEYNNFEYNELLEISAGLKVMGDVFKLNMGFSKKFKSIKKVNLDMKIYF